MGKVHNKNSLGGVIHTYQEYDPKQFPSPTQPPPDMVSGAFEHLLAYGDLRELTEEELARAVRIDPRMLSRLGPSLEALRLMLLERKRKILERYETKRVAREAAEQYQKQAPRVEPPPLPFTLNDALRRLRKRSAARAVIWNARPIF